MSPLYLIRHAQPATTGYDNLPPGPDLGPLGQQQSAWIADTLQDRGIRQIWASDFPRVLQTLAPLRARLPALPLHTTPALWEREASVEAHESLVQRVRDWFLPRLPEFQTQTTAVFSHCGPINMLLECLDPQQTQLAYPFHNEFGCWTPCAGIWELHFTATGIRGQLHPCPIP